MGARDSFGRFRPSAPAQFYLWEAEVSKRHADASTVFAVGRIWPWHTPGLTLLDGFQVGRHNKVETIEGGAYAGLIPWAVNVNPSASAWASGLYGALVQVGDNNTTFRLAKEEARLGVWHAPGAGLVTEGEILAQAWLGPFNLGGGGRVRAASAIPGGPALDRAYVDLGARATLKFGGGLHLRYVGAALPDDALLVGETQAPKGSIHAVGDVHWDIFTWLGCAGFGGIHRDRDSGRSQNIGAAEIRLPRLFRDFGGAWLGAEVSEGWMRGRLLYGQIFGRFADRIQILARVSASASQFQIPETSPNLHELGGYLQIDGMISSSAPPARVVADSGATFRFGRATDRTRAGDCRRTEPHGRVLIRAGRSHLTQGGHFMGQSRNRTFLIVIGVAAGLLGSNCTKTDTTGRASGLPPLPPSAIAPAAAAPSNSQLTPSPSPAAPAPPPPTPAERQALERAFAVHGSGAQAEPEAVPEVPDEKDTISGTITLPAANRSRVAKGDTMFLAARRAGGPPGPGSMLAVQKLAADEFPMRFTISNRDAMIPGVPFEGQMSITVRVDKDGDAMTRGKGDVYGQANNVKVGSQKVVISLDTVQTEDRTLAAPSAAMGGMLPSGHP